MHSALRKRRLPAFVKTQLSPAYPQELWSFEVHIAESKRMYIVCLLFTAEPMDIMGKKWHALHLHTSAVPLLPPTSRVVPSPSASNW